MAVAAGSPSEAARIIRRLMRDPKFIVHSCLMRLPMSFGACAIDSITETMVQEFVADFKNLILGPNLAGWTQAASEGEEPANPIA